MSLSHRPAARFFAAFYRWNLQRHYSRDCVFPPLRKGHGARCTPKSYRCGFHTSRGMLQQTQDGLILPNTPSDGLLNDMASSAEHRNEEDTARNRRMNLEEQKLAPDTADEDLDSRSEVMRFKLRTLMRDVPSSVVVITVTSLDAESRRHVPMGVAVSSFTTVSMDPPTVSFNIKQPSKTLDAIRAADGLFRVHVPSANAGGANVAEHFSKGNHLEAYNLRRRNLKILVPTSPFDMHSTKSMAPQIWDDDIQAAMECTMTQEMSVADHVVVIATVDKIEKKDLNVPAMLYINGKYTRLDGSMIKFHDAPQPAETRKALQTVWQCPKFPGQKEREDYVQKIRDHIKAGDVRPDAKVLQGRYIEQTMPYPPSALGINVEQLIAQCKRDLNLPSHLSKHKMEIPVLNEFYGRISPSSLKTIIERAKEMILRDPRFLSLEYNTLLLNIGISPNVINFLPSDILQPLREECLADVYDPERPVYGKDIYHLEVIQYRIIKQMRAMNFLGAVKLDWRLVMRLIGEPDSMATYFKNSLSSLLVASHQHLYSNQRCDIWRHVSEAEMRVVMHRFVRYLDIGDNHKFRLNIVHQPGEIMRRVGVNPTITGMDVEYFFAKIKQVYRNTRYFHDLGTAINEMLEPWFDRTITWDDLVQRIEKLVRETPHRAIKWSNKEKLAAMGLQSDATVSIPGKAKKTQSLSKHVILDTLMAKKLKDHFYSSLCSRKARGAISRFLKEKYDYNIAPALNKAVDEPGGLPLASSEEMRQAMLEGLNVDVSAGANNDPSDPIETRWRTYALGGGAKL